MHAAEIAAGSGLQQMSGNEVSVESEEGGSELDMTSCMQVARLAEQNASLQEEVRQLRMAKGASGAADEEFATLQAVNARLAEENALLSSSCEDMERRLANEGGSSGESSFSSLSREEVLPFISDPCKPLGHWEESLLGPDRLSMLHVTM